MRRTIIRLLFEARFSNLWKLGLRPVELASASLVVVLVLTLPGCGDDMGEAVSKEAAGRYTVAPSSSAAPSGTSASKPADKSPLALGKGAEATKGTAAGEPVVARKIIYDAQVDLVVESISTLTAELTQLVNESGGYLAETEVNSFSEVKRQAKWKIRVPVGQFDTFLTAVDKLGELQKRQLNSQDVTQEYFDLEARINNKQQEEKRLLKHLADSTGKLEEILTVEKELSRVRGEVEQMQGRIRYLASMAAMSTVTITASEIHGYQPPVTPTFSVRVGRAFSDSLGNLLALGKAIVLFVVVVGPWVVTFAVIFLPIWAITRWIKTSIAANNPRRSPILAPRPRVE